MYFLSDISAVAGVVLVVALLAALLFLAIAWEFGWDARRGVSTWVDR